LEGVRELGARRRREEKTLKAMVALYCQAHHESAELCPSCRELLAYAIRRLALCPFGEEKPACIHCPIHCYRPEPREAMRAVMRFTGPRMLWRHPYLAIRHLLDQRFGPGPGKPPAKHAIS